MSDSTQQGSAAPIQAAPAASSEESKALTLGQDGSTAEEDNNSSGVADLLGSDSSASQVDQEAAIDEAQANGDITKAEAKALKKKIQIKTFGKVEDFEYDFNDEEGLKKIAEKSKAFDKNFSEYSAMKKQVDELVKMLQNDPDSVLEKLGHNLDKRAEERLQKRIEEMSKSPEQIEREKIQKELEELRKEKEETKKRAEAAEQEAMRRKFASEFENDIKSGLEASKAKLPKNNPKVFAMIAQNMMMAIENGYNDVTVADIIPVVERQWKEEISGYFNELDEDMIEQLVGKPNLEKLRKKRLASRPKPQSVQAIKETASKPKTEEANKPKDKISYRDFFKKL